MATEETRRRVAHLLRRAGFGATPDELTRYAELGVEGTVDELVNYERIPDDLDEKFKQIGNGILDLSTLEDAQTWWIYRMINTKRPLQEKMTLFWHGIFATGNSKVQNPAFMHQQNNTFRTHATGNVYRLTVDISRDPAMLIWLDNATNRKAAPNENYSRELMELFTLGIGNYTEKDVQEVARAFTGWNLTPRNNGGEQQRFVFNANQHDAGPKTILGRTGAWRGEDAIGIILSQPAHATFLMTKLCRFFIQEKPDPALIERLAKLYTDSKFELKPVLKALFLAEAFYSDSAYSQYIKSPVEFLVGALRTLDLPTVRIRSLLPMLSNMGQQLYNPPNVGGWPGGRAWINPSTLIERFNAAGRLTALTGQQPYEGGLFEPEAMVSRLGMTSWEKAIEILHATLSDRSPSKELTATLLTYTGNGPLEGRNLDMKLRGLVHLLLTSAESMTS